MRYSLEPRDRMYVKGYGFMSFTRSMNNKYGQKPVDTATKIYYRCYKNLGRVAWWLATCARKPKVPG